MSNETSENIVSRIILASCLLLGFLLGATVFTLIPDRQNPNQPIPFVPQMRPEDFEPQEPQFGARTFNGHEYIVMWDNDFLNDFFLHSPDCPCVKK